MNHIIMIMSDQHSGRVISLQDDQIQTPNLERIIQEGRYYPHAYCNSPLCVPSRMSFLSGEYPSSLSIFNNDTTLPVDMPTLAHTLGTKGYRTVLIGRMHFKGEEQHHGFDERYVGDITSQYWGTGGKHRTDFGAYMQTTNRKHCLSAVGAGVSPVMVYDQMVYEEAMHFLSLPQEKPLFLVIGFYGPHFPYACESSLYDKYIKTLDQQPLLEAEEIYEAYVQEADTELLHACKASYYGLVETLDSYIGAIYDQVRNLSDAYFLYTSDHGEQCGKRHIFGKQTLYEDAISIPLVISGPNIPIGSDETTVSLLDVGKTIMTLAGCANQTEGTSILQPQPEAWIRSEVLLTTKEGCVFGQCVICWPYKAITYGQRQHLYDLSKDPNELHDCIETHHTVFQQLAKHFVNEQTQQACIRQEQIQQSRHEQLKAWGQRKQPKESWSVRIPSQTLQGPKR